MLMSKSNITLFCTIFAFLAVGCSSDSNSGSDSGTSSINLSFSDAAVDGATEVVITVDKITFRQTGEDGDSDIVVDQFSDGPDSENNAATNGSDTYTIDLLTVQGNDSRLVVGELDLPVGEYSNMLIDVVDGDINASYVTDATGVKPLKVPSQTLKLGSFTILPTSTQSMVVEFGLQQSMTYNPGPDRYILKPRGVRIVSVDQASLIEGQIDHSALQANEGCDALELGGTAGKIYLYQGHSHDAAMLVDNFDPTLLTEASAYISPIASTSMQTDEYTLSYLEPGPYTLAISCHSELDDADVLDNITVPNPLSQIIEITLGDSDWMNCAIPLLDGSCSLNTTEAQIEN